jgi:hypothetical protein
MTDDDNFFNDMMDFIKLDKNKSSYKTLPDKSIQFIVDQGYMMNLPNVGKFVIKFKNKKQVETIFDNKISKILNMDLLFWTEAHIGTVYHTDFIESYPELTLVNPNVLHEKTDIVKHGIFDFSDMPVSKDFKYIDYINEHYPHFA